MTSSTYPVDPADLVFRVQTSLDLVKWMDIGLTDTYMHAMTLAKNASHECYARVTRIDLGNEVIITLKDGMPLPRKTPQAP